MKSLLSRIALIATIVLKVIPAILEALQAFEKYGTETKPKKDEKGTT